MSVTFTGEVHPLAAAWPMLAAAEVSALADDIAANGLNYPITLDAHGRLIDGRNRLEACALASVAPAFESVALTSDADVAAFIASRNAERRHLTAGQQAAGRALMLIAQGKRQGGRWVRGAITESGKSDSQRMTECGLVADWTDLLPEVLAGTMALDAAYRKACDLRDEAHRKELKAKQDAENLQKLRESDDHHDLAVLVDDGALTIDDAWAAYMKRTEETREAERLEAEAIAKLSRDVSVAINTIAAVACSEQRRASALKINPREIPSAAITSERLQEARDSIDYLAEALKEKL